MQRVNTWEWNDGGDLRLSADYDRGSEPGCVGVKAGGSRVLWVEGLLRGGRESAMAGGEGGKDQAGK